VAYYQYNRKDAGIYGGYVSYKILKFMNSMIEKKYIPSLSLKIGAIVLAGFLVLSLPVASVREDTGNGVGTTGGTGSGVGTTGGTGSGVGTTGGTGSGVGTTGGSGSGVGTTSSTSGVSVNTKIDNPLGSGITDLPTFINVIISFVLLIAIPIIVLAVIYAGFLFVTSGGNSEKLKKAKTTLLYTLIGAALLLGAFVIAKAIKGTVDCLGDNTSCTSIKN
jgi:hypothetical protein